MMFECTKYIYAIFCSPCTKCLHKNSCISSWSQCSAVSHAMFFVGTYSSILRGMIMFWRHIWSLALALQGNTHIFAGLMSSLGINPLLRLLYGSVKQKADLRNLLLTSLLPNPSPRENLKRTLFFTKVNSILQEKLLRDTVTKPSEVFFLYLWIHFVVSLWRVWHRHSRWGYAWRTFGRSDLGAFTLL